MSGALLISGPFEEPSWVMTFPRFVFSCAYLLLLWHWLAGIAFHYLFHRVQFRIQWPLWDLLCPWYVRGQEGLFPVAQTAFWCLWFWEQNCRRPLHQLSRTDGNRLEWHRKPEGCQLLARLLDGDKWWKEERDSIIIRPCSLLSSRFINMQWCPGSQS